MKWWTMIKNKYFILFIYLFLLIINSSCKNNEVEKIWMKSIKNYENKDYNQCLVGLNNIIKNHSSSNYAPDSYYLISEIYLNEYKQYDIAVEFLKTIINDYPDSEASKKSLFTLGYINANYIDSFTDAINHYNDFLLKYPNDDLIPSVEYELENLFIIQSKIDSLINSK